MQYQRVSNVSINIQTFRKMTEDKKKEQIRSMMEKAEQDGRAIDWATVVLC